MGVGERDSLRREGETGVLREVRFQLGGWGKWGAPIHT